MLCVFEVKAFGFYLTIIEPSHETLKLVTAATYEGEIAISQAKSTKSTSFLTHVRKERSGLSALGLRSCTLIRNSYISKSA